MTSKEQIFEKRLKDHINIIIDEYNQNHISIVNKQKPKFFNVFSKQKKQNAMFESLENLTDTTYNQVQGIFQQAKNQEKVAETKLSNEFQSVSKRVLSTTNDYEHVYDIMVQLCHFTQRKTK